jgi:protein phosphatase
MPRPRLASESVAGRRPYQEDAVLAEALPDGRLLLAVADGMGGHAAGEVASAVALATLLDAVRAGRTLADAFRDANAGVHAKARDPDKQGMGTTLVAVLVQGGRYEVANVGDSRAYLLDEDGIHQLTRDHSFAREARERGQPEAEVLASKWRDALTRCIGIDAEVEVDVFGPFTVEADTALVLCSDGLHKALSEEEVRTVFGRSNRTGDAAEALVSAAYEAGSDDNISVMIAEFGEIPREGRVGPAPG